MTTRPRRSAARRTALALGLALGVAVVHRESHAGRRPARSGPPVAVPPVAAPTVAAPPVAAPTVDVSSSPAPPATGEQAPRPARSWPPVRALGVVLAAVLLVVGVVLVGCAVEAQRPAPRPDASAQGQIEPAGGPGDDGSPGTAGRVARALPPSPPTSIRIPSVGVDSVVDSVGLQPDGTLEVPAPGPHYDEAAWFRQSVTPGQLGPSVIIGHVDSAKNGPSVFYDLGNLRPGAAFTVARADGSTPAFRVDGVRSYPKDAFPTATVYGGTTRPEMRLITCGGDFDRAVGHYRDNTVVFAHLLP